MRYRSIIYVALLAMIVGYLLHRRFPTKSNPAAPGPVTFIGSKSAGEPILRVYFGPGRRLNAVTNDKVLIWQDDSQERPGTDLYMTTDRSADGKTAVMTLQPTAISISSQDRSVVLPGEYSIRDALLSRDGSICVGVDGRNILIWETQGPSLIHRLVETGSIASLVVSRDGRRIASVAKTASVDFMVNIWNSEAGHHEKSFPVSTGERSVALSSDPSTIAIATGEGARLLHPGETSTVLSAQAGAPVHAVAFSTDDRWLASAQGHQVVIWDWRASHQIATLETESPSAHPNATVVSITFSEDGERLATGQTDGTVKIWDVSKLRQSVTNSL